MSLYHDVIEALTPLVEAFDKLGIVYYIGGSALRWEDAPLNASGMISWE